MDNGPRSLTRLISRTAKWSTTQMPPEVTKSSQLELTRPSSASTWLSPSWSQEAKLILSAHMTSSSEVHPISRPKSAAIGFQNTQMWTLISKLSTATTNQWKPWTTQQLSLAEDSQELTKAGETTSATGRIALSKSWKKETAFRLKEPIHRASWMLIKQLRKWKQIGAKNKTVLNQRSLRQCLREPWWILTPVSVHHHTGVMVGWILDLIQEMAYTMRKVQATLHSGGKLISRENISSVPWPLWREGMVAAQKEPSQEFKFNTQKMVDWPGSITRTENGSQLVH